MDNLDDALQVIASPSYAWYQTTENAPYVNYHDLAAAGGRAFHRGRRGGIQRARPCLPGLTTGVDNDDWVMDSTATL